MGFSRDWGGLPFSSPEDLLNPGIEPGSPAVQADALTSELPGKTIYIYNFTFIYFYSSIIWGELYHMACAILISHLGIEPRPSVLRGQSLNHWTTREFLSMSNIITYAPWKHVWTKCVHCSIVFNIKIF